MEILSTTKQICTFLGLNKKKARVILCKNVQNQATRETGDSNEE